MGVLGNVTLDFDYSQNRYLFNKASPFEPWASRIVAPELAGLPLSDFDTARPAPDDKHADPPF